jgi:arabinogalactan endo-1,4-beta-galactosidase
MRAADYAMGADLSFLKQAEDRGSIFKNDSQAKPGLQIFKDREGNALPVITVFDKFTRH